jgi:NADPH-dependent glutamate synthase beta subunit-like oxidoreductase
VKKVVKTKKSFASRSFSSGGGREVSPLRPRHVEKKPPCRDRCPSGNRIREFLTTIALADKKGLTEEEAWTKAWEIYTDTSPFPSVCGRVCPAPCETECNRKELDGAVGINMVERTIGDYGIEKGLALRKLTDEVRSERVAIVGGGPSGLSCAYQLARRGYGVTVFEGMEKAGGMLRWGIPGYRLPEPVLDAEIGRIVDLGVDLRCGVKVGRDVTLGELRENYDAVYVALGAQQGVTLGVEGEDAPNVFSGVDFLSRFHHGETLDLGKDVVVLIVGGGDTAIDAARICKRLGANVTILYRRTRAEMPAIPEEVDAAIEEGVTIEFLTAPAGFRKEDGRVVAMKAIRMELGEPDASGRRRPVVIEGSEFEIPASAVISAVSQAPDFRGFEALIEGKSWIQVDEHGATRVDKVWAGGDVTALDLVTTAVGHGRRAAEAMDRSFRGTELRENGMPVIRTDRMMLDHYPRIERTQPQLLEPERRLGGIGLEVNLGLGREAATRETTRCMSCGYCMYCEKCWLYCSDQAIEKPMKPGSLFGFKLGNCTGCRKCSEICPCGFIDMA